ncbi:MAG TPA: LptF/LptG family permease [Anaeromyxobacteraceae bacterium]|nr:LptF/LptG family permease [Anaeromyxobacteraceae bacterium]
MRIFAYVFRRAVAAFLGALLAVVLIFLVVDFAENAAIFHGPGWFGAVLELYANRALVVAYQTAPAALLLAAAVTASDLRRTREYTAMRALGLGPFWVAGPVLLLSVVLAAVQIGAGDAIVVRATARADEILSQRFHRTGTSQEPKRWFRGRSGRRIYHLRGSGEGGTFERVTILEVTTDFRLARRIDAARMSPGSVAGEWVLEGVAERTFHDDGSIALDVTPRRTYRFEEDPGAFALRPGRPSQLRRRVLGQQIALRRRLGLPAQDFVMEWHHRLSYPLAAVPAGLVALGLALRRERRGHITAALLEAVGVSLVFWAVQGLFWSLGIAGRLSPAMAAWVPDGLFLLVGLFALRRYA